MFEGSEASMVKPMHSETAPTVSASHPTLGATKNQNLLYSGSQNQRIMWTREEMLAIAPQCKSLPDGLGTIPENLSSLFDVGQSSSVRARGKGRTGVPAEMGGRKRAEESSRTAEQTSAWRKKERVSVDMPERVESYGVKGRTVAESAWRPRRDTQDDGAWSKPSPSAAGAADGWLMPDADEEYELGGHNNNVDAFEVMRQQARAEWAQSHGVKPVQDSATEDLMKDLIAEAETVTINDLGAPPGLERLHASRKPPPASHAPKNIDIQTLFTDVPSGASAPEMPNRSRPADHNSAEEAETASEAVKDDIHSTLQSIPALATDETGTPESQGDADVTGHGGQAPVEGADQSAEHMSLVSNSNAGKGVDLGRMLNDGGVDDAAPGLLLEDMPMSQNIPRASSPPPSSPQANIWGLGLDAGAGGSIITSTDWSQMQEIWNREPASKSLEATGMQHFSDEFNNDRLNGTISTSMNQGHAMIADPLAYGRHPDSLGAQAFASQGSQARVAVTDSMLALASMALPPVHSSGADHQAHQDRRQSTAAAHGTQVQHEYSAAHMARSQQQPGQHQAHALAHRRGAAEDPRLFEMYLKQLVANAHQQQVGEQRHQAVAGLHSTHASVVHPRVHPFTHATSAAQQASLEHIRNLAPALHLAGAAVPQQRQVSHLSTARQLLPQASSAYTSLQEGHRMQDPTWMLRQLKESGHPQAHVAATSVGNLAVQQSWAAPTRMQVQYPSSAYDRHGHQATMQHYGTAVRTGPQQTNGPLQGMYVNQLARTALQSAVRQPQQQTTQWLPQATSQRHQHNVYAAQVRPTPAQGLQQAMSRSGHYAVQSNLPRYYQDNTQPGYTTVYRR